MQTKIIKTGKIQPIDANGYIVNNCSLDLLQAEYQPVLKDILTLYEQHFSDVLHSVYLRGSVAKGIAMPFVSDIDTIAISKVKLSQAQLAERLTPAAFLDQKYDFVNGIEAHFESLSDVQNSDRLQFLLKTQCICIYGTDLNPALPSFKPDKNGIAHAPYLESDIERAKNWLKDETDEAEIKDICSWIMKRIVRIGFEIVMERENCFTRDLYPCYELFSKHYPAKQAQMFRILELAVFPTIDKTLITAQMSILKEFLVAEGAKLGL